jgi:hypothetical protein
VPRASRTCRLWSISQEQQIFPAISQFIPVIANFLPCYPNAEQRMKRRETPRFLTKERSQVAHFFDFSLYFSLLSRKMARTPVLAALRPQP